MTRTLDQIIDATATARDPEFDAREHVEVFFQPADFDEEGNPSPEGEWYWQYTLEAVDGQFISRRLGTTGLNNPRIRPEQLHRALCHDNRLGIYVPKTNTWFHPGNGNPRSGWAFAQMQHMTRAQEIESRINL